MKISIKTPEISFTIPVPLGVGSFAIRYIPINDLSKEQRLFIAHLLKICKKSLKKHKGLEIVNIESARGEKIKITV